MRSGTKGLATTTLAGVLACALGMPSALAGGHTLLTAKRIHTMDPQQPQAQAMVWAADGRLLDVGDSDALRRRHPQARLIDAGDAVVVPGLIDAHAHLMGLGLALLRADLTGARSKEEIVDRLQRFAADLPEGAWLLGNGWDQNLWPDTAFPTAADLDAAFGERPVWLRRIDGHAGWANSAAMRAAQAAGARIADGEDPPGGRVVRQDGNATGVFVDEAMAMIEAAIPPLSRDDESRALELALAAAVRNGLTGVHDMGVSREGLALYRAFADAGRLPLRVSAYADGEGAALDDLCSNGLYAHAGGRLEMRGVKLYIDGALGSRGAALLDDYSDDHGNTGLLVTDPDAFRATVDKAARCGVQVAAHAIGDRGNRLVLDTYEATLARAGSDPRWRVEHAQIVAVEDIPRFARMQVIASMQPTHATSDMGWAGERVGEARLAGAYAWRSLLDSGARLALGSDFPVEQVDPRLGLYAAATRQDRDGRPPGGWLADQKLTVAEALRGFTADAAYASFDEAGTGQLRAGLHADFLIVEDDPLAMPVERLHTLRLRSTWVDGRPVYEADASARE